MATPEGGFSQGAPGERLVPQDTAERLAIARRLIADRCLYGVDINPMAVEMAKLSLWLITLDAKRPFTFLDHAFKCGDALLGLSSSKQLEDFSLRPEGGKQIAFSTMNLWRHIDEAKKKREALEVMPSDTPEQIAAKVALYAEAEEAVSNLKAAADVLVAVELEGLSDRAYEAERQHAADQMMTYWTMGVTALRAHADERLHGRRTLHWPLAFPEIMERGGFDAFVGNPPFKAGAALGSLFGDDWRGFVVREIGKDVKTRRGQYDLCVFFFLQARRLVVKSGVIAGIATNSFPQGDSRIMGLSQIYAQGFHAIRAINDLPWPGSAATHVCLIWLTSNDWKGERWLDSAKVEFISDSLSSQAQDAQVQVHKLEMNRGQAFRGAMPYGEGFFINSQEAAALLAAKENNRQVLMPYLIGDDLNTDPHQRPSRHIINFHDWPLKRDIASNNHPCPKQV